jgi:hypothetical protein
MSVCAACSCSQPVLRARVWRQKADRHSLERHLDGKWWQAVPWLVCAVVVVGISCRGC